MLESKRTERYGRRAMDRPRVLLVPTLTEIEWKIRPLIEEWAEYDLLGAMQQMGAIPQPQ